MLGLVERRSSALGLALLSMIATPASARAGEHVWVHFADKGPAARGAALAQALAERRTELPARTLARRVRARGPVAVDARDLPVSADYLAHVEATGARVRVTSRWLNAVSVDATPAQLAELATLPEVSHLTPVARRRRDLEPSLAPSPRPGEHGPPPFGLALSQLELLGATTLQQHCGLTGAGVVVGVQDSGFDLDHQALAGLTVLAAHDFIGDDDVVSTEPGDPDQQASHGTRILALLAGSDPGTFMGAAPGVAVILSKTEDVSSETPVEEDYYVAGLEWIEAQGADVFTASLGYLDWYQYSDLDGQTTATAIAVNAAFDNGLVVLASLGNFGPTPMSLATPSDAFGAIGVGAVDLGGVVAGFSSRGPAADGRIKPDVMAPGAGTLSVAYGTTDQYAAVDGTSVAAPLAAGLVALLLEARPTLTAQQLLDLVRATSTRASMPDNDYGYGLLDGRLASGDACGCNDSDADGYVGVLCGGDDCEDGVGAAHPGGTEICDGYDDDCDGTLPPDEVDGDGDGVILCAGDCDDADAQVAPGLLEVCGNGLDDDCIDGDEVCPASTGGSDGPLDGGSGSGSLDGAVSTSAGGEPTSAAGESGSDTAPAEEGEDPGGCACTTTPGPARGWGMLVLPLLLRRRRRVGVVAVAIATLALVACGGSGSAEDDQGSDTAESGAVESSAGIAPIEGCELPVAIPQLDAPDDASTGFVRCNDGTIHRAAAVECAQPMPTGVACNGMDGACAVDADCTAAPHGACLYMSGFFSGCECVYGCASDADCADGQICACGGAAPGYPTSSQCISATCVDDQACPDGACGLAQAELACGPQWLAGCRTPADTCTRAQDCPNPDDNCVPQDGDAWACSPPEAC